MSLSLALVFTLNIAEPLVAKPAAAPPAQPATNDQKAVQDATSPDDAVAQAAWAELRREGPAGLEHLRSYYADVIALNQPLPWVSIPLTPLNELASHKIYSRFLEAQNAIGAQYDNVNGLYWYTDLAAAEIAARAANKPILTLRLLGKLNEPLTCANSRFFRITLYANQQIAQALKDKFILHWETFRPVPVVTVDFGDGRKLVRTITGNSIHYILSPNGDLVDALPGLYAPAKFLNELNKIASVATEKSPDHFCGYRQKQLAGLEQEWKSEMLAATPDKGDPRLTALRKTGVDLSQLEDLTDERTWKAMAAFYPVSYDDASTSLINTKFPQAETAMPLATSKGIVESPLLKAINGLKNSTSLDTVKNNLCMRSQVLQISLQRASTTDAPSLDSFNDQVYAEVFLTPKSDPYLGLEAPGCISAINDGGEISMGK